jgi:hypothetical protein
MVFRSLSAAWSRFFGAPAAPPLAAPPRPPAPESGRAPSRDELEVAWLLRCLPPRMQAALVPDLLWLKHTRPFTDRLPVEEYTWPEAPGVWRPRYDNGILKGKPLEGLCSRLHAELRLGVLALCAPERALPRPMCNALLAMQGRRLGQVSEALGRWLHPEELLALWMQELAMQARR